MQLALAAVAASSGLGEDLGGTAALGGGLPETFQQLLPSTVFFFFFFPGGGGDGDGGGGGERKRRKRPQFEPMQPFGFAGGASLP